ncbi:uncharacterized protein LOC106476169, partial [Limulus polyphemus]|uniref:Uncharacterized protein LOC106476169 n=1 Tax=Limulus polyphemus TaxID=6850 RepID=A0ABM1C0W4_LIMPO
MDPSGNGCRRDWAFERVRGKELVDADQQKVTVEANTREECEAACLQSQSFACRSAEFNHQLSECRISPHNRFSSSEEGVSLSSARFVVDYLENNCIREPRGFCNLKMHRQQMALVADNIRFAMSIDECQQQCFHNEDFICRAFSYDSLARTCAMSHHTLQTPPDGTFARSNTNDLIEISTCFDVFVNCEPNMMKAKVVTNSFFNGKIYAKEKPKSCVLDVSQSLEFTLPILLAGSDCGTVNEEEGKFSNVLVIQSNDYVVTSQDKAVGVQCSYDVGNKTGETQVNVT